jgi:hypothetical protein
MVWKWLESFFRASFSTPNPYIQLYVCGLLLFSEGKVKIKLHSFGIHIVFSVPLWAIHKALGETKRKIFL